MSIEQAIKEKFLILKKSRTSKIILKIKLNSNECLILFALYVRNKHMEIEINITTRLR